MDLPAEDIKDKTLEELGSGGGGGGSASGSAAAPATASGLKAKHIEKAAMKEREDRNNRERAEMAAARGAGEKSLSDPNAERARIEALQKLSDLRLAAEDLGVGAKRDMESLLAMCTLTSRDEFARLGRKAAERVHQAAGGVQGAPLAMRFYTEALSVAAEKFSVQELEALEKVISAARTKKSMAAKASAPKASGKSKGPKVHVGADDGEYLLQDKIILNNRNLTNPLLPSIPLLLHLLPDRV
jgi:hypothetical protein